MDGVLADTEPYYQEIEKRLFQKLNLLVDEKEHDSFKGVAADRMWEMLKEKYHLEQPVGELLRMTSELVIPYFRSLNEIKLYDNLQELIELFFEKHILLAVASSSYPEVIETVLVKTGLKSFFNVVTNSRMAGASKPDPAIYLLTAAKLGIEPSDCLVIEDSSNGIRAAKSAGMFCIAADFPENKSQDKSMADLLIKEYRHFLKLLEFPFTGIPEFYVKIEADVM